MQRERECCRGSDELHVLESGNFQKVPKCVCVCVCGGYPHFWKKKYISILAEAGRHSGNAHLAPRLVAVCLFVCPCPGRLLSVSGLRGLRSARLQETSLLWTRGGLREQWKPTAPLSPLGENIPRSPLSTKSQESSRKGEMPRAIKTHLTRSSQIYSVWDYP